MSAAYNPVMAIFSQAGPSTSETGTSLDLQSTLRLAKSLQLGRRPVEALLLLDKAVARYPTDAELLHLRGNCLEAASNAPAAFATYMSVLNLDPNHIPSLCCVGAMYKARGMLQEAMSAYAKAHELCPENTEIKVALAAILTDLGTRAKTTGTLTEAMAAYQRALELAPGYAPAYYNMGVLHSESKQYDIALEWYQRAVAVHPGYAEAHCNMGVIFKDRGDLEAAIGCYERALEASPNFSIVKGNLAIALTDLGTKVKLAGRLAEGCALYERALAHNPKYADALYNLGVAYGESGQLDRAIFMYETAVHYNPACAEAHNNLGVIYKKRENLERAMECYAAALTVKPDFPQSLNNMGVIYTAQGRAQEALTLLTAAITACPTYAEAHNNLGVLQRDVGAISEALASYARCLELAPDSRNAGQNRLLALNYKYQGEDPAVCGAHLEWGERFSRLFPPLPDLPPADMDLRPDRTLRVGYVSPDFFTHSVSYFAEAPLTHHTTPARQHSSSSGSGLFQHYAYCCAPKRDNKTSRLRASVEAAGGVWREVTALSEQELASVVREDKIDILVELTGHTANNRLGTMAMRPATLQATWIGYPNSTGLKTIDFRITDALCDPLDTKQTFAEQLVRLPGCFLCYTPAPDAPAPGPAPAESSGFVTFGSFNNLAKITPEVLRLWARILLAIPRSRLVLKNKPFACDTARAHVLNLLAAEGIESWRVDLLPLAASNAEHLAMYSLMDISLDTFPYAGTTTTCESLYMGVPCLTLGGHCHAHNVGVSLLTTVGLADEWVAYSEDQYLELAVRHASNVPALARLRQALRPRMVASRLCDGPGFVLGLEAAYRRLWVQHCQQHAADAGTAAPGKVDDVVSLNGVAGDEGAMMLETPSGSDASELTGAAIVDGEDRGSAPKALPGPTSGTHAKGRKAAEGAGDGNSSATDKTLLRAAKAGAHQRVPSNSSTAGALRPGAHACDMCDTTPGGPAAARLLGSAAFQGPAAVTSVPGAGLGAPAQMAPAAAAAGPLKALTPAADGAHSSENCSTQTQAHGSEQHPQWQDTGSEPERTPSPAAQGSLVSSARGKEGQGREGSLTLGGDARAHIKPGPGSGGAVSRTASSTALEPAGTTVEEEKVVAVAPKGKVRAATAPPVTPLQLGPGDGPGVGSHQLESSPSSPPAAHNGAEQQGGRETSPGDRQPHKLPRQWK